jgi:HEPN domain-containing protein
MPAPDPLMLVVRSWVLKAENDLKTAVHTLILGAECPTDTVCFHAQQCVEKYIKALLVFRATPFPKTHDIHVVRALLPPRLRPTLDRKDQDLLTQYATARRYPLGPDAPLSEARRAVALARGVRREIRTQLPAAALRRRRK